MQPTNTLLCSQEPTSCPYPEPDESSPCCPIYFLMLSCVCIFHNLSDRVKKFLNFCHCEHIAVITVDFTASCVCSVPLALSLLYFRTFGFMSTIFEELHEVVEANLLVVWSHPDCLELVMKCQNNCIKMGDQKRLKSQTLSLRNFDAVLYLNMIVV
jgi:hypothetical protein